jgi:site-specific recombinase XerD
VETNSLAESFIRHCQARNLRPKTIVIYRVALDRFAAYLKAHERPSDFRQVTKADIEGFLAEELNRTSDLTHRKQSPGSVVVYHSGLKVFFNWLADDEEIPVSPMRKIPAPKVPDNPPPVLSDEEIQKLLATVRGKTFTERRDAAIMLTLLYTGIRKGGLVGLKVEDYFQRDGRSWLHIVKKGGAEQYIPLNPVAAEAIDRYLRRRDEHKDANRPELFLGARGPMTGSGLLQMVKLRSHQAGLNGRVFVHMFRHTFAHKHKLGGTPDDALRSLGGWSPNSRVVDRYGRAAIEQRAIQAAENFKL